MAKYSDLKDKLIEGQWLFTCSMQPLQFSHMDTPRKPEDYFDNISKYHAMSETEKENWAYDDFITIGGSHHSMTHCSCKLISAEYAEWFIKNKCWEIWDKLQPEIIEVEGKQIDVRWDIYEKTIRRMCEFDGITYEGF